MKVARRPCFSAIDLTMYLKKAWRSAVFSAVVVFPVHLELAVGVLVIVLIRLPAERHASRRRFRRSRRSGASAPAGRSRASPACRRASEIALPSGVIRKNSHSTPVLHLVAGSARAARSAASAHCAGPARPACRPCRDRPASQPTSGFQGNWMRLSGSGIASMSGSAGVMSSQVAKPAKPAPVLRHLVDRRGRHQLGAHGAEQIGVGHEEILDAALFRFANAE